MIERATDTRVATIDNTHLPRRAFALIAVAVVIVRLGPLVVRGRLTDMLEYDDGVYYSASANLIRGVLPYRDFVFVHPPGVVLFLAPVTAVGRLIGDGAGMAIARIVVSAAAALSGCLIAVLLQRYGNRAAVLGGLLYAVWAGAAAAERTVLLEPFLTVLVLLALVVLRRADEGRGRILLAGVIIGLALGFKLWAVGPLLVLAVMVGFRNGASRSLLFVLGAAGTAGILALPFFLAGPSALWRDIVTLQVGRPYDGVGLASRIQSFDGDAWPRTLAPITPSWVWYAFGAVAVVLLLSPLISVLGRRTSPSRWGDDAWWSALLAMELAMLLAAPSFYYHYVAFAAPMICLLAGRATARLTRAAGSRRFGRNGISVVLGSLLVVLGWSAVRLVGPSDADLDRLEQLTAGTKCVWASAPTPLVAADLLSDQIDRGCPMSVDPFAEVLAGATGASGTGNDETYRASQSWQQTIRDQWAVSDVLLISEVDLQRLAPATARLLFSDFRKVDHEGPFAIWRRS